MGRKAGLNVLFVLLAVGTGLLLSRKPWEMYREQKIGADMAAYEMQQAEESRSQLLKTKADVDTPIGRERNARNLGLIGPGERRVGGTP